MITFLFAVVAIAAFFAGIYISPKLSTELDVLKTDLYVATVKIRALESRLEDALAEAVTPEPAPKTTKRKAK